MREPLLIGLTCAALLLPGLADAQLQGFGLNEHGLYDINPEPYDYPSQQQQLDEALQPYGDPDPYGRIERNFERQDRWDAVTGCWMMDRNPAAQQRCFDGLR